MRFGAEIVASGGSGSDRPHDLNRLAAYIEGRLERHEQAELIEHLAACRECRAALAGLTRAAVDPDSGIEAGVRSGGGSGVPRASRPWLAAAAGLAVAAVATAVMLRLASTEPDDRQPAPLPEVATVERPQPAPEMPPAVQEPVTPSPVPPAPSSFRIV